MSKLTSLSVCTLTAFALHAAAAPVINEIMFHPLAVPGKNLAEEWIEIFKPDAVAANVGGCASRVIEMDLLAAIAQATRPSADRCAVTRRH